MIWLGWLFWVGVAWALGLLSLTAIANTITFPRLKAAANQRPALRVSVLIPARNEAAVISQTVQALLNQPEVNLEVLLLDDHSSDSTAEIALQAANGDPRLRVLQGQPLPSGWLGKNWACQQLAEAADPTSDLLIFCDADVRWQAGAVAALLYAQAHHHADLLTVWPTQHTETWAERLVVPLMGMVIGSYLPEVLVRFSPWTAFAAANGQCLVFTRAAYAAVGGHAAVQANIIEDVALARRVKQAGLRLVMVDGSGLIGCRMYTDWASVRAGFGKNILAGHGNSLLFLAVSTLFHWAVFVLPWLWLLLGGCLPLGAGWPIFPAVLVGMGLGVRWLTAWSTRQRLLDGWLLPVSVVLMTAIAAQAAWWQVRYGGPQWKGRQIVGG